MRRADLLRVARRVATILGENECLLVGGLAVGAHGFVRATRDVDFIAKAPLAEVRAKLIALGIPAVLSRGDPIEGGFPCVKATMDGIRVDVMPPLVSLSWERAIRLPMGKVNLPLVDLEGLLRLKLRAQGPKDPMDVAALVLPHQEHRERARDLARAYGVLDRLDEWLRDPRLRAEAQGANEVPVRSRVRSSGRSVKNRPGRPPRRRGR